jgi:hypothetical protein
MPPFFFCISRTLAIFDCGKQRAIRANYFAAKKSASRDKIRKWKTGFRIWSLFAGCVFYISDFIPGIHSFHKPEVSEINQYFHFGCILCKLTAQILGMNTVL